MKNYVIILLFLTTHLIANSQESEGIKFTRAKSWNELKQEAKSKNKLIFMDAYTTWCAPCKVMAKDIFPKKEVGIFFNENFINAAVQFDKTKADNDFVKGWYNDVKKITEDFKVDSYPTYLFFNSDGVLVYKIIGASENASSFITKAINATIPEKQYYLLKSNYENGQKDALFIKKLLLAAKEEKDLQFLSKVGNEYLSSQTNILTKENVEIIKITTANSTDIGFKLLLSNSAFVDSILGNNTSFKIVSDIISNEIVIPYIRNGGTKTDLGSGLFKYSGEVNKNVDWVKLESILYNKYPDLSKKIIFNTKPIYYDWLKDWENFSKSSLQNIKTYPELVDDDLLRFYVWRIINYVEDKNIIQSTIEWINTTKAYKEKNTPFIIVGYSILLNKNGNKNESLVVMEEAIECSKRTNQIGYAKRLEDVKVKMINDEKVW